jgi:hypothetical protein
VGPYFYFLKSSLITASSTRPLRFDLFYFLYSLISIHGAMAGLVSGDGRCINGGSSSLPRLRPTSSLKVVAAASAANVIAKRLVDGEGSKRQTREGSEWESIKILPEEY